ncbi:MAG TPA: alpha/beta fold hydrolase [Pyrinomonadaceae bacterium]|nr:alpha/beta fold hydrolase [Pyrinomonadaceae bacterium]
MAKTIRLFKSFYRLLLPVAVLFLLAVAAASIALIYKAAHPPATKYLVTPEKYGRFSARGARVTEEAWQNADGMQARGWLLRGAENSPAVLLLHRYGADRSHNLNLGVKLNEATNFTILMPDQRGHGENPPVKYSSFGGCETNDAVAAVDFLRNLKSEGGMNLVGRSIGIYGVDMGAMAAISTAAREEDIRAIALDSVPADADALLASSVDRRFPFASSLTTKFAEFGSRLYFFNGCYNRDSLCGTAKSVANREVLLLAGSDAPAFQTSTEKLSRCFPQSTKVDAKTDLNPSGYSLTNASLEQSEAYDQRVIAFFKQSLGNE